MAINVADILKDSGVGKVTIFHHFIGFRRYGESAREDTSKNDARDAFPLLFLKYYNVVIWLTVRSNTFGRNRIGLAGNDYPLHNLHRFSLSETDTVNGIADPRVGGRIVVRIAGGGVRHSIVDVPKYGFGRLTLSVYTFDGIDEILPFPRVGLG